MKKNVEFQESKHFHTLGLDEVFTQTSSSPTGLTTENANLKLQQNGKNTLPNRRASTIWGLILKELINPIVLLLLFAGGFSILAGEWIDAGVILFIIVIDVVMGVTQSKSAERTANSLLSKIKTQVKTLRDNEKTLVEAENLVVGDIIFLESGDKVPADCRIITCQNLKVNESLLTGESTLSEKGTELLPAEIALAERKNMLYSGTIVASGRASAVVVATALATELGKIAKNLVDVKEESTPLNKRIKKFSKQITFMVSLVAIVLFIVLWFQGNSFNSIFLFVVALAVSAIPEGLPLAVTIALSVASKKMGKKNVIVKNLASVEALGSCTVIASDKTGTLTLNQQTAQVIVLASGETAEISGSGYNDNGEILPSKSENLPKFLEIAKLGVLNNEAKLYRRNGQFKSFGDSIDIAFLALGLKAKTTKSGVDTLFTVPYESEKKYSAVFYKENQKMFCTVKGSIEKVLSLCSCMQLGEEKQPLNTEKILSIHEKFAGKGLRLIAVANGEFKGVPDEKNIKNLVFLGFVGFIDPLREESIPAVKSCTSAGIKVLMITGDHPLTAFAIANQLGICTKKSQVAIGDEIEKAFNKGEKYFDNFIKNRTVFSRVSPTDKLNIVNSLKRQGEFVAVTGDGVNDAPAIKTANIGVAMGSGTDTSKETADMIIADDNFSSIVEGIKEGRTAYSNIRKVTYLLLSQGIGEILFFFLSIIAGLPLPLVATQLLYLNIVTNGLQDFALSFERTEKGIMLESPRPTNESLFSKSLILECIISGLVIGTVVFGLWAMLMASGTDLVIARSIIMALMVFIQNFHTFNCRSETQSILKINPLSNPLVLISVTLVFALQLLIMLVPALSKILSLTSLPVVDFVYLFIISSVILIIMETYKYFVRNYRRKHNITRSY